MMATVVQPAIKLAGPGASTREISVKEENTRYKRLKGGSNNRWHRGIIENRNQNKQPGASREAFGSAHSTRMELRPAIAIEKSSNEVQVM